MSRTNFEKLRVYRIAETLADEIWNIAVRRERFAYSTRGQALLLTTDF